MRGFIVGTIVTAIAFYVVTTFLPGFVSYKGELVGLLVLAVIFGIVNGLIGPIVRLLALPLRMMTLGLVGFVINAGLLLLNCRREPIAFVRGEPAGDGGDIAGQVEAGARQRTQLSLHLFRHLRREEALDPGLAPKAIASGTEQTTTDRER